MLTPKLKRWEYCFNGDIRNEVFKLWPFQTQDQGSADDHNPKKFEKWLYFRSKKPI